MSGLSSIVVGVDFTACSAQALQQAMRLARATGAALHVVHVIDTLVVIELEGSISPMQARIREELAKDAGAAWKRFAAEVPAAAELPIEISINNRVSGIRAFSQKVGADLLVLGAFGDRPPDLGIGTLATACVRGSPIDVLLVRDVQEPGAPFATIVAAVDFSDTSLRALERAAAFAARDGATLHALHVFEPPGQRLHFRPTREDQTAQRRETLERQLEAFCRPVLERHPTLEVRFAIHEHSGHRSGIVAYATAVAAQLIVLGTRGRTNLRDILLGSTAEKALAESRCSILAVKPASAGDGD